MQQNNLNPNTPDHHDQHHHQQPPTTNPWDARLREYPRPELPAESWEPEIPLPPGARTCLNSLKHGGTAERLFIPGEDPRQFYALLADFFEEFKPATASRSAIVYDYCHARWFFWRRQRAHAACEWALGDRTPCHAIYSDNDIAEVARFDRYLTQAQRALQRAMNNAEAIRKDAVDDERWREQLALKLKIAEQKAAEFALVSPKIAAEARLKARIATDELARLDSVEACSKEMAETGPLVIHDDKCVIKQLALVTRKNGNTHIVSITPSNEEVKKIIADKENYLRPPERVLRTMSFCDGPVPVDYHWVFQDVNGDKIEDSPLPHPWLRFTFTFDRWQDLADLEEALLSHQAWEERQEQAAAEDPPKAA